MEKLYELLQQISASSTMVCTSERTQEVRAQLEAYVNELIQHDFSKLVDLLYRVDVNEKKLKELLAQRQDTSSAALIADLLIERQLQKQAWRQSPPPENDIPEEDRW
jgi:hypothetical protein